MKIFLFFIAILFSITIYSQIEDFAFEQATGFTIPQRGVKNISIVNENIVWALAYDGSGNNENVQEFTKTINGGDLWIPGTIDLGNSELGIGMITAVSNNIAWVVAYPIVAGQIGGIFKTIDGGTTWFRQNTALFNLSGSFPNVVHFWDENKGFCQGDPVDGYFEIYTTTDGGNQWNRVPSANIPLPLSGEYGISEKMSVTGDAIWFLTNKYRLYRSYDFGNTFEVFQIPYDIEGPPADAYSFSFNYENNGYLMNTDTVNWKSSDGGESWVFNFPDTGRTYGGHIYAIPNTEIALTSGDSTYKGLSYTLDGGNNWVIVEDELPLTALNFYSTYLGWIGSFNTSETEGGIYKYESSCSLDSFNKYLRCSLQPNPVFDSFQIQSDTLISKIQIFTTLGQEVYTYKPNATSFTVQTAFFPKATYLVKLTNGSATNTIKMIKL